MFSNTGSQLKDEHHGMVHYHLTDKTLTWAQVTNPKQKYSTSLCLSYVRSPPSGPKKMGFNVKAPAKRHVVY